MKMKKSAEFKHSLATPIKQQSFESVLTLWCNVYSKIAKRNGHIKPIVYIDLNAGPGIDPEGKDGSPLIFQRIAEQYQIQYKAIFYEANTKTAEQLHENCKARGYDHFEVRCCDNATVIDKYPRRDFSQFGIIYSDVSNAPDVPLDLLANLNYKLPKVDILINLAFASYKRTNLTPLYNALPHIKKHWKVRQPAADPKIAKFQWSLVFGLNWGEYPDQKRYGFYDFEDPIGKHYWDILTHRKSELVEVGQLPLWEAQNGL